jgi:hypothetical protein
MAQQKRAKALRIRYGVAEGVRPATNGERCRRGRMDEHHNERAVVISAGIPTCAGHLANERKPRRR